MKLPLISILLIYSIIFNFSCKKANPDEDLNSALTRLVLQANYVTITGTARGPGVLKNAQVDIIPLPSDGSCVNSSGKANGTSVGSSKTDTSGNYSITYPRKSGLVCVVVTPTNGTTMTVAYAGKKDISWPGSVNITGIIREPIQQINSITGRDVTPSKKANITPFTRMAATRFAASRRVQTRQLENNLFLKAVGAVYPRAVLKTDEELLDSAYSATANSFFTGLNTKSFKLEEANPDSNAYNIRLGALTTKSESLGLSSSTTVNSTNYNGNNISGDNIEKLLNYMETDFSDGSFDGKKVNSSGVTEAMATTELSQAGLTSKTADTFLKSELTSYVKNYASLDPSVKDTAYKAVRFCDPDDQTCSELTGDSSVFTYPEDGETNIGSYPFFLVSFINEMDTTTLTAQDTDGACSGTIQISNDNFATCLGGILDASDPYFIMFEGLTEFSSQAGSEVYKIKVTTGVKDVTGASPLTANYQMATGFTVAGSYVDLGNGTIADNESYLVWSQCPEGTSGSGCGTGGVDTSLVFCNENDDDCNGGFEGGTLLDGLISDGTQVNAAGTSSVYSACEALNSSVFGGRTSWRVPSEYELFVFEYNYYANSSFATYFPFDYTSIDGLWAMESIDFENALFLDLTGNGNYIAYKDGTGYLDEADFNYYSFSTGLGVHCVSDEYPF